MRFRPLATLAVATLATLALTSCSAGETEPTATPTPSSTASSDAGSADCAYDVKPGAASDSITVEGEGTDATLTLPEGMTASGLERTVVAEGTGDVVHFGDVVDLTYQIVDTENDEVLDSSERGENGILSVLLDPSSMSLFVAAVECLPVGSQTVLVVPGEMLDGGSDIAVYSQVKALLPSVASGTPVDPVAGMPTVELAADGAPTITIPDAAAPTQTQIELLQRGDGQVVKPGDTVVVQYRGVKWSDGTEFDSSWSRGAPLQFSTSVVVTGFRLALEGQAVGSQVLVVMPPEDGYGPIEGHALQEETLVFVVDILAISSAG